PPPPRLPAQPTQRRDRVRGTRPSRPTSVSCRWVGLARRRPPWLCPRPSPERGEHRWHRRPNPAHACAVQRGTERTHLPGVAKSPAAHWMLMATQPVFPTLLVPETPGGLGRVVKFVLAPSVSFADRTVRPEVEVAAVDMTLIAEFALQFGHLIPA